MTSGRPSRRPLRSSGRSMPPSTMRRCTTTHTLASRSTRALWQRTMDVNLRGPMTLARLTIPSMLERGGGAFVFNSSMASYLVHQYRPGYSVSKAGVNALTYFIAGRYGRKGIRANAIMPFVVGGIVGDFAGSINCIGRSGTAEEIGEAVVFLCSDRASLITGQVIHLDGGLLVRAPWPQVDDE